MIENIISTNALQPYLIALIPTRTVCVRKSENGVINLIPIKENSQYSIDTSGFLKRKNEGQLPETISEFYGMFADKGDPLEKFLERKHADKEFDR